MTIPCMDMRNPWLAFVDASIHLYNELAVGVTYSVEFKNQKKGVLHCEEDPGASVEHPDHKLYLFISLSHCDRQIIPYSWLNLAAFS